MCLKFGGPGKPIDMMLPDINDARKKVIEIALRVKEARGKNLYKCSRGDQGCFACKPYETILRGEAEYLGVGGYGQDIYFL